MIDKSKIVLGIDIGTSSIKAMTLCVDGVIEKVKAKYTDCTLQSIDYAIKSALSQINTKKINVVSFSSQVGTYVIDDKELLTWNQVGEEKYLNRVKKEVSNVEFEKEISMPHPNIVSYPLPRLLNIKDRWPQSKKVCTLKDYFIEKLTGNYVTEAYSWRGLTNLKTNMYSQRLLDKFDLKFELPRIMPYNTQVGEITENSAKEYNLPNRIPVIVGANDFYCGLLGMGITKEGDEFNLSGTSEHIGVITKDLNSVAPVSSPYFVGNATYGGTKSSGTCCDFAINEFGIDNMSLDIVEKSPPVFLPYLSGERAPVFDESARGVFFGINNKTDKRALAYSVLEGMCFGVYDAGHYTGAIEKGKIIGAGGSFVNDFITELKATIFNKEIVRTVENDVSVLGAGIIGLVGIGDFNDIKEGAESLVKYKTVISPNKKYTNILKSRFNLYRRLYKDLKEDFKKFNTMNEGIKGIK